MKNIYILDCTLRDGGYINNWNFGKKQIRGIISNLVDASVDIIECGFLRDVQYDEDVSVYSDVRQIEPIICPKKTNIMYVAMLAIGDISPDKIGVYDGKSIDGIRITFHKHEWTVTKEAATHLMEKGYKVFVQPVGITSYSDMELLQLLQDVNNLQPYAFYVVDTLGIMHSHELLHFFSVVDFNLDGGISLGFHSHNNLQMSFSNGIEFLRQSTNRAIIIDASVYGMGRGVGNLPTELLADYINNNICMKYDTVSILSIADRYLMSIYAKERWGYALPYFISAMEKCHPNYATYLLRKCTLTIKQIASLLKSIPKDKSDLFDESLIEKIYMDFQYNEIVDTEVISILEKELRGKNILLIAPGASINGNVDRIHSCIQNNNAVVISVNFVQDIIQEDMIFLSNRKRIADIDITKDNISRIIATSNLCGELPDGIKFVNYKSYLGYGDGADNVGAMLIRILAKVEVAKIFLAGFDGFGVDVSYNYYVDSYRLEIEKEDAEIRNKVIAAQLKNALGKIPYEFITNTKYKII